MKYTHPRSEGGANGIYGGMGSKPGKATWVPWVEATAEEPERVPRRFRRIRLKRAKTRLTRPDEMGVVSGWMILLFLLLAAVAAAATLFPWHRYRDVGGSGSSGGVAPTRSTCPVSARIRNQAPSFTKARSSVWSSRSTTPSDVTSRSTV